MLSGVHRPFPVSDLIGRDALMNGRFTLEAVVSANSNDQMTWNSDRDLISHLEHERRGRHIEEHADDRCGGPASTTGWSIGITTTNLRMPDT